jgi:hypothetical protein
MDGDGIRMAGDCIGVDGDGSRNGEDKSRRTEGRKQKAEGEKREAGGGRQELFAIFHLRFFIGGFKWEVSPGHLFSLQRSDMFMVHAFAIVTRSRGAQCLGAFANSL